MTAELSGGLGGLFRRGCRHGEQGGVSPVFTKQDGLDHVRVTAMRKLVAEPHLSKRVQLHSLRGSVGIR